MTAHINNLVPSEFPLGSVEVQGPSLEVLNEGHILRYFTHKLLVFLLIQFAIIAYIFIQYVNYHCANFYTNIYQAKSRKYQAVFNVKSRVKTWQFRGIWHQVSLSLRKKSRHRHVGLHVWQ